MKNYEVEKEQNQTNILVSSFVLFKECVNKTQMIGHFEQNSSIFLPNPTLNIP